MFRRAVALLCPMLLTAASALAQLPPPVQAPQPPEPPSGEPPQPAAPQTPAPQTAEPQGGRVFCGQSVTYRPADPAAVPERYRRFLGVWSDAAWDAHTCAALIVQNIASDGTAAIVYVYGPLGSGAPAPGGVLHGTGVVRGGQLRFQNSDGSQFAFRPGLVDLVGRLTTPQGTTFETTFKQTP